MGATRLIRATAIVLSLAWFGVWFALMGDFHPLVGCIAGAMLGLSLARSDDDG